MEESKINHNIEFFFKNYSNKRNEIFEYINSIVQKESFEENEIRKIIEEKRENFKDLKSKINKIKFLTINNFKKNLESHFRNINNENKSNSKYKETEDIFLKKNYNLGLKLNKRPFCLILMYYENINELSNKENVKNINEKKDNNDTNIKKKENNYQEDSNIENNMESPLCLFNIDFLTKIKICEEEEWICNATYAFYLINKEKKLKNPKLKCIDNFENSYNSNSDISENINNKNNSDNSNSDISENFNSKNNSDNSDNSNDSYNSSEYKNSGNQDNKDKSDSPEKSNSSYSLKENIDIEHLVFITNNKYKNGKKIIELVADLNISDIYYDIKSNINPNYQNEFIKMSYPGVDNVQEMNLSEYINNEIYSFFNNLLEFKKEKALIFQDENNKSSFDKFVSLNYLYMQNLIRFLYLDLNIINSIKKTIKKRKYLSYFCARIYNSRKNFKKDFELFIKENLEDIREDNFIENFIKRIIAKNDNMIEKENEFIPFYIIIDNINSAANFKVLEKIRNYQYKNPINIFGFVNIDSLFGQQLFISLYNKKYSERNFYIKYLFSANENKNLEKNINSFFKDLGKNIIILKDFIQLLYFKDYISECDKIDYEFMMKYIKYIKLNIKEDCDNCLTISDINFKTEEIRNKFIKNYRDILIQYLNINNNNNKIIDENIENLFLEANGIFFEKQIILDVLLDKIKNQNINNLIFQELKVQSIYCMRLNNKNIDINIYKDKNIIITQNSRTGEIYDFGIIVNDTVKLYQISINKPEKNLKKLDRILIEVDAQYMNTKVLNKIGNYKKFNFGLIVSKSAFEQYLKLKNENKSKKINTNPYYLMKKYCNMNKYEFLIYDLNENKFYEEGNSNQLIEYKKFYEFIPDKKLNIYKLENIFSLKPTKNSIKYVKKEKIIKILNKSNLFTKIDDKNEKSLNIIGKFKYKEEFLNIDNIVEDNFCLFISHKHRKKNKSSNIFKYKNKSIYNKIDGKKIINEDYSDKEIKMPKRNTNIILLNFEKDIKFLNIKRKRN